VLLLWHLAHNQKRLVWLPVVILSILSYSVILEKSYSAQSYIKTDRLSFKNASQWLSEQLIAVLKICPLSALQNVACESITLNLEGRLFQTFGPQTEKARLPNWVLVRQTTADLVVDVTENRWCRMWWGRWDTEHNIDGKKLLCMDVATLYVVRNSTDLPSVLWHCCLGIRKIIQPVKNWVMRCWRGYL